jgi:hypothetical protein
MTSSKSVSWSALVNVGNNESLALTVSGEAANPDEARDIFAFAIGQLIGVANSADEATAPLIRAYVSRLVQTEEARPVEQDAPAPVKEPAKVTPPVAAPAPVIGPAPTVAEQAAAAVAQCIKPPATAPDPTPAAPPEQGASAPAETSSAPPMPKPAPAENVCEICGASVTKSQANLSQLFMSKTLCKPCMDQSQGGAQ